LLDVCKGSRVLNREGGLYSDKESKNVTTVTSSPP